MRLARFLSFLMLLGGCLLVASDLRQIGIVNLPGSPGFGESAFANGMLLLTHPGASAVDVFDPTKRRVIAQITGLQAPRSIAVDEQGGKVYVADHGSNSIAVITTNGWKVVDSIALPDSPDALLLDAPDNLYWADAENGTVSRLDLHTKQNVVQVDIQGTPRSLAFDNEGKLLFVTEQDQHQIAVLDPQLKIARRLPLNGSQPTSLIYDPQSHELYVAVRSAVLAISPDTGAEIDRVTAPAGVDTLWLDSDSRTLYAASEGSLLVMSAKGRLAATDTIPMQVKGHTVAYDPAKRLVLVPGGREGKSKLLILRPMNPNAQPGTMEDTQASVR
ncbi:MAG TPA: YncE family protein [Terriglobales bacterium]|jgi:YVTN family beta-propeller protein|nr:YncE family protein [Terriglobales bacterium]